MTGRARADSRRAIRAHRRFAKRERYEAFVAFYLENDVSVSDVCRRFNEPWQTVDDVIKRFLRFGDVLSTTEGRRADSRSMSEEHRQYLFGLVEERADRYADELQDLLTKKFYWTFPISLIERALLAKGYTWKSLERRAMQQNEEALARYVANLQQFSAHQLVFIDESHCDNRNSRRRRGRALTGYAPVVFNSFGRGNPRTLLAMMDKEGFILPACKIVAKRAVDAATFLEWLQFYVIPQMSPYPGPRSVLILDNAPVHKKPAIRELAASAGIAVLYLPPYFPQKNPIELGFGSLKDFLRRNQAEFADFPDVMIQAGCAALTPAAASGFFRKCGVNAQADPSDNDIMALIATIVATFQDDD